MITRDENHVYRDKDGKIFLSVTQHLCISGLVDFSMVKKEDLDFAALRGHHVHKAHYLYLLDDLDIDCLDESYKGYCEGFIKFYKENNIEGWDSESILSSDSLRTAGSFDLICKFGNQGSVVEFKTSTTMPKTIGLQTAGYKRLWNANHPQNIVIQRYGIQLLKTGKYRIHHCSDSNDNKIFKNIVHNNWWALNKGIIPVGAKSNENVYNLCKIITGS